MRASLSLQLFFGGGEGGGVTLYTVKTLWSPGPVSGAHLDFKSR